MKNYLIYYYECNESNCRGDTITLIVSAPNLQMAVHYFSVSHHECTIIGAEEQEQE